MHFIIPEFIKIIFGSAHECGKVYEWTLSLRLFDISRIMFSINKMKRLLLPNLSNFTLLRQEQDDWNYLTRKKGIIVRSLKVFKYHIAKIIPQLFYLSLRLYLHPNFPGQLIIIN